MTALRVPGRNQLYQFNVISIKCTYQVFYLDKVSDPLLILETIGVAGDMEAGVSNFLTGSFCTSLYSLVLFSSVRLNHRANARTLSKIIVSTIVIPNPSVESIIKEGADASSLSKLYLNHIKN